MKNIFQLLLPLLVTCILTGCLGQTPLKPSINISKQPDITPLKPDKYFKADLYQMYLPKDWSVEKIQVSEEWLSDKTHMNPVQFKESNKVIGELHTENYLPDKKPIPFDMSNHSEVIEIKDLDGFFTDVMLINLEITQPAASNDDTVLKELHICFIIKDINQVYDFSFNTADVSEQTALNIAKSFELVPGGVSDTYFKNIVIDAKRIESHETWVISAIPPYDAKDVSSTAITLKFNQDMDPDTLNMKNIIILEGKHSRIISDLFKYEYNTNSRELNISFIDPDNNYGSGNGIDVYVTGDVRNKKGQRMEKSFVTGFSTR
jgi:hypothetical protein